MIRAANFFLVFLIALNSNVTVNAQNNDGRKLTIEAQLQSYIQDYKQGMRTKNPDFFIKYYHKDIYIMPAFQKTLLGKEKAFAYHVAFFDRFEILEYDRKLIETLDLGAQLCVLGTFTMKVQLKSDTKQTTLTGKYMNIWQKEADSISLVSELWNYNHHTELTEQLKFDTLPGTVLGFQGHLKVDSDIRFEIEALNKFAEEFISDGDHNLWSQLYTKDAIALFSYHPILNEKKELDAFIKKHVVELPIFEKLDIRNNYINDLGGYVVNYASHIANWRNDDYSGISTGKGIKIWKRTAKGSLKIHRQISTYDYNY